MKFLPNVVINFPLRPEVLHILNVVELTAPTGYEPTITSGNDGTHGKNSLHYSDCAFDIRVKDYPGFKLWTNLNYKETKHEILSWIKKMREYLEVDKYDVIFDTPGHKNHIHIEYDPK